MQQNSQHPKREEGGGRREEGQQEGVGLRREKGRGGREERGGWRVACQHALQGRQHNSACPKQTDNGEEREGIGDSSATQTPGMSAACDFTQWAGLQLQLQSRCQHTSNALIASHCVAVLAGGAVLPT